MKSEAYRTGYSLEALRDLELVPLTTPQAQNGYFLHESLIRLFQLVNEGFNPRDVELTREEGPVFDDYGFRMNGLHSPLFDRASTPLLSSVKFRNIVLQEIIQQLSLSREKRGNHQRGRISYAQLGINQLGAVYEGLLSYSGFFAQEPVYEVKPKGEDPARDDTVQTYFVPVREVQEQPDKYDPDEFVYENLPDGTRRRKRYERGTFIFRLAGRDRQKSASYYTPEVLTRSVVKYSLRELLADKIADDILDLTICEPAAGSGAFINEALNQLADAYLERKQAERDESLSPDAYREERQKVKAWLAANNAYGVDLNPTAIALAQVSIWLNTIYKGSQAPWYNARLAVGNSLIGARRAVYAAKDILSGDYLDKAPEPVPLGQPRPAGSVYHWLLPDKGMAPFDKDKVIRQLAPDPAKAIRDWRRKFTAKISRAELRNMQILSDLADDLWQRHLQERRTLLARTRTHIPLWGQPDPPDPAAGLPISAREKELAFLQRPTSPYRRLKLAMDAWTALWFWPIDAAPDLPTRSQFLNDIEAIFKAEDAGFEKPVEQISLFEALDEARPRQAHFADMTAADVNQLLAENPRLHRVDALAARHRFHHWELAFPEVFAARGGFDLILGNPPWVKVQWAQLGILSDLEPYIGVKKLNTKQAEELRHVLLGNPQNRSLYLDEYVEQTGMKNFAGYPSYRSITGNIQTNTYMLFIVLGWEISSPTSIVAFIHDQGLYSLSGGEHFRSSLYRHLLFYFHFHNELKLFKDVDHTKKFEVSIFHGARKTEIQFQMIVNLFHPRTIDGSFKHDGEGLVPGIKDANNQWELRGHKHRIVAIDDSTLRSINELYGNENSRYDSVRLPQIHSIEILSVIKRMIYADRKIGDIRTSQFYPIILDETKDLHEGNIHKKIARPTNIRNMILSSPQISVSNPLFQEVKPNYRNRQDYENIDLQRIPDDFLPRTLYHVRDDFIEELIRDFGEERVLQYRLIHRKMVLTTYERTLITTILPPYVTHINSCWSTSFHSKYDLCLTTGFTSSIVLDFIIKTLGKLNIYSDVLDILPINESAPLELVSRTLRLNCLTNYFADLWESMYNPAFNQDAWTSPDPRLAPWHDLTPHWQRGVALRTPFERRQALVEIDVLAAMALGLTLDELLTIYRVQFPVLQKYERRKRFDQRGMEVPTKTRRGELILDEDHPDFPAMVPPFTPVDREEDYARAWRAFEDRGE